MTAFYQQIYRMFASDSASNAVFTDFQSLSAKNGEALRDSVRFYRQRVKPLEPKPNRAHEDAVQVESSRPILAPVQDSAPGHVRLINSGLRLGDVVRTQEHYWKRTGREITGAIIRFEPIPGEQIAVAGSDHWAYLNSGEGPISLAILEKVPNYCG